MPLVMTLHYNLTRFLKAGKKVFPGRNTPHPRYSLVIDYMMHGLERGLVGN